MGAGEGSSAAKHSKLTVTQEANPPPYADWSTSMQAYYGGAVTPPFYGSNISPPTPHPYIWGGQPPMMPPYGTPIPYPTLYPPAGVYAHRPGMPMTPSTAQPVVELEPKAHHGKKKGQKKKYKGSLGNGNVFVVGNGEGGKAASSSGNDGATAHSAESEQDGSSDANHLSATAGNLNMGIDLWNPSSGDVAVEVQPNTCDVSQQMIPPPIVGREGMIPDQWTRQDERELKRQKRKQSNRESARKSRLRKQAECEELIARVQVLSNENGNLKDELQRLSEECKKLASENSSMKDKLNMSCEPDVVLKLDGHIQSQADDEGED